MRAKVLNKLIEVSPEYVSGEQLSCDLGVTRTSVWKCINELKKEGYVIDSSTKKGYRLLELPDIISVGEITCLLDTAVVGKEIRYLPTVDSTNNYAKKIAQEGCTDGAVVIADCQSNGRGRMGRNWNSADKKGIWMSVLLRPSISIEDVQVITLAASVAVVNAIKDSLGIEAGIKWPNDVLLDGKKVCGILTEMSLEMERVNYLVLGIGLNVNQDTVDFPEEIADRAISLKSYLMENMNASGKTLRRVELIKSILYNLDSIYAKINSGRLNEILDDWRKNALTLGREVCITHKDMKYIGIARDITSEGKLVVDCRDGITREVLSGEVSVRGLLGYI